ncbi:hypothetical protein SRABI128_03245 [Microbacterium sp. Bi128]|nr:hypothetical protein SRABI128_03245 [Microbacterium sp. Bi128]
MGTPASCSTTARTPSTPSSGRVRCCQTGRNRAYATGGTGSTLPRIAASERIRSRRSTSVSHHSVSSPRPPVASGRKKPLDSRPCDSSRCSVSRATATPTPRRSATASVVNGPCVRANRATRSPSGSASGSRKAFGMPTGSAAPSASRRRPASSMPATRDTPAIVTGMARLSSTRVFRCADASAAASVSASRRTATSAASRGPSSRSRSATPSTPRARRSGSRRCASRSNCAITSGSRSSRISTLPSSSLSRAGSTERAAARRSARGESPSYMKAPT